MTVDDVVKGLKLCKENDIRNCHRCPYCGVGLDCNNKLKEDAAYLIMHLQKTLKAVQKNSEINFRMWKWKEAQAEVEQLKAKIIDCVRNGDLD